MAKSKSNQKKVDEKNENLEEKDFVITEDALQQIEKAYEESFSEDSNSKDTKKKNGKKQEIKIEEKKEEVKEDTDVNLSANLEDVFLDDLNSFKKNQETKEKKVFYGKKTSPFLNFLVCLTVLGGLVYFISSLFENNSVFTIISTAFLTVFSILFLIICITSRVKSTAPLYFSTLLLLGFFIMNTHFINTYSTSSNQMENFSGKSLTEVVKWAKKNNIKVTQQYEYSDMVPEYEIISQSIPEGKSLKDLDELVVSVSEGPNPYKEVIVPSMLTWDSERVIHYVLSNYLSNVHVEFVDSNEVKDTVIEQSTSGNLKRSDELNLTFSFGEEGAPSEVSLIDFSNKTQFEIEFYMKQNDLDYEILYDFSDKVKKGYGLSQSIDPGEKVSDETIQVTISKGPKIVIPDLSGKSVDEITEWAIENRLKLEFINSYDDHIKRGNVISVDKKEGDVVEQGSILKVTLSLGSLKVPKFDNIDDFYDWADQYGIKYEVQHEFSDSVDVGEIIEFSPKPGTVLKNDEIILVKVSDGKKVTVPNIKGLSKSEATKKLKSAGLKYNFVYKNSSSAKDTVLSQSLKSGSEVSEGTTVTVTLSNGNSGNSSSSSNNNSSSSGNSGNQGETSTTTPSKPAECNKCTILRSMISSTIAEGNSCSDAASKLKSFIQSQCKGLTVTVTCQKRDGYSSKDFISSSPVTLPGSINTCDTPSLNIVLAE